MEIVLGIIVFTIIVIFALVALTLLLAAFIGEPLSNNQEDFEESDALIESERKIRK